MTSILLASSEGLPLRIVANGVSSTADPATDFSAVVVPGGSDIQSVADLEGRRVADNNLKNIGEVTIRKGIEDAGGDGSNVEFVELPFPEMPAAVAGGNVDAAWVVEPFVTVATGQGVCLVFYPFAEPIEDLTVAMYFTLEPTIQEKPELVDAFQAAINESLEYANSNPDEVRRILLTYTQIPRGGRPGHAAAVVAGGGQLGLGRDGRRADGGVRDHRGARRRRVAAGHRLTGGGRRRRDGARTVRDATFDVLRRRG